VDELIRDELLPDEKIVWSGQPSKKKLISKLVSKYIKDFFIYEIVFLSFFALSFLFSGKLNAVHFLTAPFIIAGLLLLVKTIILIIFERNNIFYFLTNKRLISFIDKENTLINKKYLKDYQPFKSVNLEIISLLYAKHSKSKIGSIYAKWNTPSTYRIFEKVDNPNEICQLILKQDKVKLYLDTTNSNRKATYYMRSESLSNPEDLVATTLNPEKPLWTDNSTSVIPSLSDFSKKNLKFLFMSFFVTAPIFIMLAFVFKYTDSFSKKIYVSVILLLGAAILNYPTFSRFLLFAKNLGKNYYSIFNNKIHIKNNKRSKGQSYNMDTIKTISLQLNKNNRGNVNFGVNTGNTVFSEEHQEYKFVSNVCFYNINNPVYAYKLITQQMYKKAFPKDHPFYVHECDYENINPDFNTLLLEKEKVIWTGKPKAFSVLGNTKRIVGLLLLLIAIALSLFIFIKAYIINEGFTVNILPFLAFPIISLSLYIALMTKISSLHKKTSYTITDKGICIYVDKAQLYYKSIWYPDLERINISEGKKGTGTIYFNSHLEPDINPLEASYLFYLQSGFYEIENADYVYDLIMELYDKHKYSNNESSNTDRELIL